MNENTKRVSMRDEVGGLSFFFLILLAPLGWFFSLFDEK